MIQKDIIINGSTKIYGLIGNPVSHTLSPTIHNTTAKIFGHNIAYIPLHVENDNLQKAIEGAYALNIQGLNVTVPYKTQVMKYLYALDKTAETVGAVNTLKYTDNGYVGYNTDYTGLKRVFGIRNISFNNKTVVILGAGGAAYAVAAMAADFSPNKIIIVNRTLENSLKLISHMKRFYDVKIEAMDYNELDSIDEKQIVIQTTSIGLKSDDENSPIKKDSFFKNVDVALDIIYKKGKTRFLQQAEKAECTCIDGFDMLVYQGLDAYEIWQQIKIDSDIAQKILESVKI